MKTNNITITKKNILSEIEQELIKREIPDFKIKDILSVLNNKSYNTKLVFYYRMLGLTVREVGNIIGIKKSTVSDHTNNFKEIRNILLN